MIANKPDLEKEMDHLYGKDEGRNGERGKMNCKKARNIQIAIVSLDLKNLLLCLVYMFQFSFC